MDNHAVVIRRAGPGDAAAIAAIQAASWRATYRGMIPDATLDGLAPDTRLPMWEQILGDPESPMQVWVADIGDRVAGFASAGPARGDATIGELYTIYLDPVRAGQGIGHALLVAAEAGMCESGFARAVLWVLRDNAVARRFYERHGWAADGAELVDPHLGPSPVVEVRYARALGDA